MQVQAIVDHHHPGHDGTRTTITKVRFMDPTKPEPPSEKPEENNEVRNIV